MSNDSVQVTIGGDASQLLAALAIANAQLGQTQAQMRRLATEMVQTGKAADQGLRAQLGTLGLAAGAVKDHIAELDKQMNGFGRAAAVVDDGIAKIAKSMNSLGGGGSGGGGGSHSSGPGRIIFEIHALADELLSGRVHQAMGTFSNFSYILYGMSPAFAAAAVGAVGLGVAVYETAKYFHDIKATKDAIVQGLAYSGNFGILDPKAVEAVAEKLRSLKGIFSGIGESDVRKIAVEFAQMGNVSSQVIDAMALDMQNVWQQFDSAKEDEAAKNMMEVFSKPLAPIEEIQRHLNNLNDAEKEQLKTAQATGDPIKAQAALQDILAKREANATQVRIKGLQEDIAKRKEIVQALKDSAQPYAAMDAQAALDQFQAILNKILATNAALKDMGDKLRSAAEPAPNVANAMRDWTKAANPQGTELEKLDEEIAKGKAMVERARSEATKGGGSSIYGGMDTSADLMKASAALDVLIDKRRKLNEEMTASNPRQKAEIANLQAEVAGHQNAVDAAQSIVYASREQLKAQTQPKFQQEAQKQLLEDEKALAAAKRANAESQFALEAALAGKNYETRHAAEVKLNAEKAKATDGDPTKLNEVAAERARIDQTYNEQKIAESAAALDQEMRDLRDATTQKVEDYEEDVRNHQISAQKGADYVQDALQDEWSSIKAMYDRKAALYTNDLDKQREVKNAWKDEDRRINDQTSQNDRKAVDASAKAWEGYTNSVNSAVTSQINGLLRGTTSWSQALKNVLATLTENVIKFFVDWGLKAAENVVLQIASQNQVTSGLVAALGIQGAAQGSASKPGVLANIQADAGEAFAGFAAFFAPTLGPGAIGAATGLAASVQGTAMGMAAFDIGAWNVPGDQIAMIHKNELVMPAAESGAFRSMLTNAAAGGGGGAAGGVTHNHNWNINAVDSGGVKAWFHDNASHVASALYKAVSNGDHYGLKALGAR